MISKIEALPESDKILAKIMLPESLIEKKPPLILKDYQYYQKVGANWNGSEEVSAMRNIMKKFKLKYKKNVVDHDEKIGRMQKEKERIDETRRNFQQVSRKNATLQCLCEQNIVNWDEKMRTSDLIITDKELVSSMLAYSPSTKLRGRADNIWNDFTNAPEKIVKLACPPKLMKIEEKAIDSLRARKEKLHTYEKMKTDWIDDMKKETKSKFENQKMKNSFLTNLSRRQDSDKIKTETQEEFKSELIKPSSRPSTARREVMKKARPFSTETAKSELIESVAISRSRFELLAKPRQVTIKCRDELLVI